MPAISYEMSYEQARKYFLQRPEAIEDYPFGPAVAVYKVKGKMFATLSEADGVGSMNLKCDPGEAIALRDIFEAVVPGYHMNKQHWNTVILNATVPDAELQRMIDRSYGLVVKGLKKSERSALELRYSAEVLYR
jgi:predicted DNA-binding protein (MmcQ/YjbR family)